MEAAEMSVPGAAADAATAASARFVLRGRVGQGTFAVVARGVDTQNGDRPVAIKQLRQSRAQGDMMREVEVLNAVQSHPNVIELLEVVKHSSERVDLVMPLCSWNLEDVVLRSATRLSPSDIKTYAEALLRALEHCHARHVVHRDIKANNLLMGPDMQIKLADFGSARNFPAAAGSPQEPPGSPQMVTRNYRPPELMFGLREHGPSIDIWSAACLISELFKRQVVFKAETDLALLGAVFEVLGTPTDETWPDRHTMPYYMDFRKMDPQPLADVLSREDCKIPETCVDLLHGMFRFDFKTRLTAAQALAHPWFSTGAAATPPRDLDAPHGPVGHAAQADADADASNDSDASLSSWSE